MIYDHSDKPKEKTKTTFTKVCGYCGQEFEAETDRARWCSDSCKMHAYRQRKRNKADTIEG